LPLWKTSDAQPAHITLQPNRNRFKQISIIKAFLFPKFRIKRFLSRYNQDSQASYRVLIVGSK
jgi:hypothetical protein